MKPSQLIFQSPSWEEFVQSTNSTEIHTSIKYRASNNPEKLVKSITKRVRYLRRYRLNSAFKNKPLVEKCYASDLLSHSASTMIGKVLAASMDCSMTAHTQRVTLKRSSSKSKSHTVVDDDGMSDISVSSDEDETSDPLTYVWILGMQFVVFDSSIEIIY